MIRRKENKPREEIIKELKEFKQKYADLQAAYKKSSARNKQSEERNRLSLKEWQSTFDAIEDIVILLKPNHEIIKANKAALEALNQTPHEIAGKKCYHIVHNTDSPILGCPCEEACKKKRSVIKEYFQNGRFYELSAWPVFDENNIVVWFTHVVKDITERKQAEQALIYQSQLQKMLRKIATDYINLPLTKVDQTIQKSLGEIGEFVRADRVYVFDYDWKNKVCSNTYEWCNPGIQPQIAELQGVKLDAIPQWVDTHKQGKIMHIPDVFALPENDAMRQILEQQEIKSLITIPIMDGGNCVGFVGFDWVKIHHEYSDEEKLLLSLYAQMLVNVKNRLTLEKGLIVEKEKAQAADRLKTAFLNNISHEVRTPLNGILGFGQMMAEEDLTQETKAMYLKILKQSSDRLINTITDYMDISLIVSGNVTVNKKKLQISWLFNELAEFYATHCKGKGLEFKLILPPDNEKAEVESDAELLKKVFIHLLNNALKFTGEGTIKLGYRLKQDAVECFVGDTGKGIDAEMQALVFNHFTQEDTRIARGYEGSGLGLTISKGLVELLGGEISLKSEKGKGTTVSFTLPQT